MAWDHLATLLGTAAAENLRFGCRSEAHSHRYHCRSLAAPDAVAMQSACRREKLGVFVRKRLI